MYLCLFSQFDCILVVRDKAEVSPPELKPDTWSCSAFFDLEKQCGLQSFVLLFFWFNTHQCTPTEPLHRSLSKHRLYHPLLLSPPCCLLQGPNSRKTQSLNNNEEKHVNLSTFKRQNKYIVYRAFKTKAGSWYLCVWRTWARCHPAPRQRPSRPQSPSLHHHLRFRGLQSQRRPSHQPNHLTVRHKESLSQ